ncbi:helix-turn-helix transcriptional regulator [Streptomyces solincola]|uniref:Helix-turn-helix transcriptional regulator n=1 Tax=Streptomyces solincola TaxID=2100817 RepID=A0A2S9PZH0_9ACTN|nr:MULTISPECIES: helix-turn-helix transcriptional regulator [Streptomyces]PRH79821.1 helix-turn-helix transcriptional regulator [Streptomyces solincola]
MLDVLGMNAITESVYRGMLAQPQDGVAELSTRLRLTEPEVRAALDELSELALIRPSADDSQRMHAVSPHLGMEILLARQQAELAAQQKRVEESRAAAVRLISEFAHQEPRTPGANVQYLEGIDVIRDHLTAMNDEVRDEFLTFAPGGPQTAANMRSSRPLNQRLLERGVQMRTIYLDSIRNDPATVAHAEWITSLGGQVRTVPSLPNRMIICDRRVAIVAGDSDNTGASAAVLRAQGILTSLTALFENVWRSAEPLGEAAAPADDGELNAQQAEALRLLALGYTDETIAKRLGVSPRTARRISTTLMTHLDARSRFQAGAHAAHRGLIRL